MERIEREYADAATDLERADIASALARMEKGRRNAFYGRIRADGILIARAIDAATGRT